MTDLTTLNLKPADGLIVRDPHTGKPLSINGEKKPRTPYWLRRLRDGDVVDANAPKPKPASKNDSKKTESDK